MQLLINATPIDYMDTGGDLPVVVFLHGWLDQKSTWRVLIDKLRSQYRCIALDLPNFGASGFTEDCVSPLNYAEYTQLFLRKLGVEEYTLVGHSMGGQIAIYGVGASILQPRKLILLASAGVRQNDAGKKLLLRQSSKIIRKFVPEDLKRKLYKQIGSDYDPNLYPILKKVIIHMLDTDVQPQAREITAQTMLIYGSKDRDTPPAYGRTLHQHIHGSSYNEIADAAHMLHHTHVNEVYAALLDFMEGSA